MPPPRAGQTQHPAPEGVGTAATKKQQDHRGPTKGHTSGAQMREVRGKTER